MGPTASTCLAWPLRTATRLAGVAVAAMTVATAGAPVAIAQPSTPRPANSDTTTRSPYAADLPAVRSICRECGTVRSIARRERPRWSSVVGTAAAFGVVPRRLGGPAGDAAGTDDAAPGDRDATAPRAGASAEASASGRDPAGARASAAGRGVPGSRDDPADADAPGGRRPGEAAAPARRAIDDGRDEPLGSRRRLPDDDDSLRGPTVWAVSIRMDDGSLFTTYLDSAPALQPGDRVTLRIPRTRFR